MTLKPAHSNWVRSIERHTAGRKPNHKIHMTTEPNNLRLHYLASSRHRQRQKFHHKLLLWAYLFAVAAILAGAFASAL